MTAVLAHVDDAVGSIDDDLDLDPPLAACVQRSLVGPHFAPVTEPMARPPMTVSAFGMNLHAATTVDGRDRKQLERLCRYLLRPPFAHDAVKTLPDGRVRILFKQPSRLGVAHVGMDIEKFMARLCALVPPPGFHMTRYYGIFASHHRLRARIIPKPQALPICRPATEVGRRTYLRVDGALPSTQPRVRANRIVEHCRCVSRHVHAHVSKVGETGAT